MSAEYMQLPSTELVPWSESAVRLRLIGGGLGRHALLFDGFEPMDHVESPYADFQASLEARVVDQPAAIEAIVGALERSAMRLPNDARPIANFAFLGPTGVGKSETAKTLAELLDDNGGNLIKIDCSDYSNGHEVATLTGAPVGYIGSHQPPFLAKEKVEQPGVVILFDEIEKGSRELYNLMLQIMGDGQLQLKNGQVANFRDAIIILTSNLGAKEMATKLSSTPFGLGATQQRQVPKKDLEKTATKRFTDFFPPEFINRLDKMVVFHPLTADGLSRVLDTKLNTANEEYEHHQGVRISLSEATRRHLVDIALKEPHNGARPLVRALESEVQTTLGRYVSGGHIQEGTHVKVFHASEAPNGYEHKNDSPLIFTAKTDTSIKKRAAMEEIPELSFVALGEVEE